MQLPSIGFGTSPFRSTGRVDMEGPVKLAIDAGFRLFDTAEAYGNELGVGRSLRTIAREEVAIVGKVWPTNFRPENVRRACEGSLRRLGIEAFDVYLLHDSQAWHHVAPLDDASVIGWDELARRALPPGPASTVLRDDVPLAETWGAMQELVGAGLARAVGVSNFDVEKLERLSPAPAANQIACPPDAPEASTVAWCQARGVTVFAHSPLSSASTHGRTPHELLRWYIGRGVVPLPSSTNRERIRANAAAGRG